MLIMILQASQSRVAQEALTGLEKRSAPFEEQLSEAWKFIGLSAGSTFDFKEEISKIYEEYKYHGREEWLLRWLLKKLQSPKDNAPRYSYISRSVEKQLTREDKLLPRGCFCTISSEAYQ